MPTSTWPYALQRRLEDRGAGARWRTVTCVTEPNIEPAMRLGVQLAALGEPMELRVIPNAANPAPGTNMAPIARWSLRTGWEGP